MPAADGEGAIVAALVRHKGNVHAAAREVLASVRLNMTFENKDRDEETPYETAENIITAARGAGSAINDSNLDDLMTRITRKREEELARRDVENEKKTALENIGALEKELLEARRRYADLRERHRAYGQEGAQGPADSQIQSSDEEMTEGSPSASKPAARRGRPNLGKSSGSSAEEANRAPKLSESAQEFGSSEGLGEQVGGFESQESVGSIISESPDVIDITESEEEDRKLGGDAGQGSDDESSQSVVDHDDDSEMSGALADQITESRDALKKDTIELVGSLVQASEAGNNTLAPALAVQEKVHGHVEVALDGLTDFLTHHEIQGPDLYDKTVHNLMDSLEDINSDEPTFKQEFDKERMEYVVKMFERGGNREPWLALTVDVMNRMGYNAI